MTKLLLPALSLLLLAASPNRFSDQEAVTETDKQLNLLIVQQAARFYADEFILTTSSGKVKLKKDMLTEIASPDLSLEINETTHVVVRALNTTAVLTGILHQKGIYKEKTFDVKLNVTDTWVKTTDGWKLLAGHATLLPSN
jgi:hypothetical protein